MNEFLKKLEKKEKRYSGISTVVFLIGIVIFWSATGAIGFWPTFFSIIVIGNIALIPAEHTVKSYRTSEIMRFDNYRKEELIEALKELKKYSWDNESSKIKHYKEIKIFLDNKLKNIKNSKERLKEKSSEDTLDAMEKEKYGENNNIIHDEVSNLESDSDVFFQDEIMEVKYKVNESSNKNSARKEDMKEMSNYIPTKNPFSQPIAKMISDIRKIDFIAPYVPQTIELILLTLSTIILCSLYVTVGIASQVESTLRNLIRNSQNSMENSESIERSAYAVTSGIYILFWFPVWVVLAPFNLLGWSWNSTGIVGVLILVGIVMIAYTNRNEIIDYTNSKTEWIYDIHLIMNDSDFSSFSN